MKEWRKESKQEQTSDTPKNPKSVNCVLLLMSVIVLLVVIVTQIPFHYTGAGLRRALIDKIESQEAAGTVRTENIQFLKQESNGDLSVLTFSYPASGGNKAGYAIFAKQLFLPLYRLKSVYVGNAGEPSSYSDAAETFRAVYLINIDERNIEIILDKRMLGHRIMYMAMLLILFNVVSFCRRAIRSESESTKPNRFSSD